VIELSCPNCNAVLKSSKAMPEGKRVQCFRCGRAFAVPATKDRVAEDDSDSQPVLTASRRRPEPQDEPSEDIPVASRRRDQATGKEAWGQPPRLERGRWRRLACPCRRYLHGARPGNRLPGKGEEKGK